jgi:hypothetical protein
MEGEKSENEQRISQLKNELFILMARRSLIPSIQDNGRQWVIMAELYELTQNEKFNLKSK